MNFNRSPNPVVRKIGESGNGLIPFEDVVPLGDRLVVNDAHRQAVVAG